MFMRAMTVAIVACLAAVLLYGCNREAAQPPAADPNAPGQQAIAPGQETGGETAEQMVERWKALANTATREKPLLDETAALAQEISLKDPHALLPLLDLVGSEQSTPYVKILATLSLSPIVGDHMGPRLLEMVKPEKDSTTRACATNLLRQVRTEEATSALKQLKTDSDPRVKLYAQIGLGTRDPNERKELYALWHKPETTDDEKGTIIEALSQFPTPEDLPLMQEAAAATTLLEGVRVAAVTTIGLIGGSEQVAVLTTYSQSDPSEEVQAAAKMALDGLNDRLAGQNQLRLPLQ